MGAEKRSRVSEWPLFLSPFLFAVHFPRKFPEVETTIWFFENVPKTFLPLSDLFPFPPSTPGQFIRSSQILASLSHDTFLSPSFPFSGESTKNCADSGKIDPLALHLSCTSPLRSHPTLSNIRSARDFSPRLVNSSAVVFELYDKPEIND